MQADQWLTSRETAELLGISSPKNLKQVTGFDTIKRKPGAPYNGYYYRRADVERVAAQRKSGQAWRDSYTDRQAGNRKQGTESKRSQFPRNGRSCSDAQALRNQAIIHQQEQAVKAGKLKPVYLPMGANL